MTGNVYCLDPLLTPAWLSAHRKLGLCFLAYLSLVTWFVATIRHTSQCLTRYCLLGQNTGALNRNSKNFREVPLTALNTGHFASSDSNISYSSWSQVGATWRCSTWWVRATCST